MTKNRDSFIIFGMICFLIAMFFTFGWILNNISLSAPKGMTIPCDKIAIITNKYDKATTYGGLPHISHIIVIDGHEIPFHNNFALDGGSSDFKKIPLNTTLILVGSDDVYEGTYVSGFKPIQYVHSSTISNGCVIT